MTPVYFAKESARMKKVLYHWPRSVKSLGQMGALTLATNPATLVVAALASKLTPLFTQQQDHSWQNNRLIIASSRVWVQPPFALAEMAKKQGILKEEVTLYHWPPVWLVWNQLYDKWQYLFLFGKQTNPNQSQEVNGKVILPPLVFPGKKVTIFYRV